MVLHLYVKNYKIVRKRSKNMMDKLKKRASSPLSGLDKTVNTATTASEEPQSEPIVQEPVAYKSEPAPATSKQTIQKTAKKGGFEVFGGAEKIKYTATMSHEVRANAKIAAISLGLTFSEFVEEAVRAYLLTRRIK